MSQNSKPQRNKKRRKAAAEQSTTTPACQPLLFCGRSLGQPIGLNPNVGTERTLFRDDWKEGDSKTRTSMDERLTPPVLQIM